MAERTLDEALDEVDKKEEKEKEEKEKEEKGAPQDIIGKIEELGFEEKEDKPGLWFKSLGDDNVFYWDFRKTKKGTAYVATKDGFMDEKDVKAKEEYTYVRQEVKNAPKNPTKPVKEKQKSMSVKKHDEEKAITLRGTENDIMALLNSIRLDSIIEVAKDGLGEGILYHNLGEKIGMEPSAELVDMICCDMGNIETEIVEHGTHHHVDIEAGNEFYTYYAIVKATDKNTGTTGLGSAEQVIDYKEMEKNGRCFSLTLAIRKAERNAKERCINVPRKALVALVKKMLKEHKNKSK